MTMNELKRPNPANIHSFKKFKKCNLEEKNAVLNLVSFILSKSAGSDNISA